jgi:hypothetical protein
MYVYGTIAMRVSVHCHMHIYNNIRQKQKRGRLDDTETTKRPKH